MFDLNRFQYNPTGWKDCNSINYFDGSHSCSFVLFGHIDDDILVEGVFTLEKNAFESKSICLLSREKDKKISLISLYARVPKERYDQLYSTLVRNSDALETITVGVSLEKAHQEDQHYLSMLNIETHVGKYFHTPL